MAHKQKPHDTNRGTSSGSAKSRASSGASSTQSGVSSTQSKSAESTRGRLDHGMSGRPDAGGNRSAGQGNLRRQSSVETDGGAPSRQTSTAGEEEGQL